MLAFANAIQNHTLLNAKYTKALLEGKAAMGRGMMYAYLFGDSHHDGHRVHGHNGGAPGISSNLSFYPELGYTYVVLSNYDGGAEPVAHLVNERIWEMARN